MKTKICSKCKKEKLLNNFFKDKNCIDNHEYQCKSCRKKSRKLYLCNYYRKNKDIIKNNSKLNYKKNKKHYLEIIKIYRIKNKEKIAIRNKKYNKTWKQKNKQKCALYVATRRAKITNSQSEKTDINKIKKFYTLAYKLSIEKNIKYVVDHIKPISKGGKHHHNNLQVITGKDNLKKWNKYPYKVNKSFKPDLTVIEHA